MDSLPRLLPIWNDIGLQELFRNSKKEYNFKTFYPPNYGGIGIDINDHNSGENSSYSSKQLNYAASSCSLPFLPLKEIASDKKDPCLENLKKEKFEFVRFCNKLCQIRRRDKLQKYKLLQQRLQTGQENSADLKALRSLIPLAENFPKRVHIPNFNVAYAGGALAISKSQNSLNLLHTGGEDFDKFCITPLQKDVECHFKPDNHEQITANLDKSIILQIEPTINDSCLVRQKNSFHLVNMTDMNIYSKKNLKSSIYHVAVSPYNPMEILSVYEKGTMKIINFENRNTLSISEDICDLSLLYPTWRCGFGSHPFSVMCMNEKTLHSFDLREKNFKAKEIYSISNPSCYINEELVAMKLWEKNPFQHLLSSNHHLIICDERYPNRPVMHWNHTLKDYPIYLECANLDDNISCVVIGTQETQEVSAFFLSQETDIQPVSLSPPLLLSPPSDCIDSLRLHSHYVAEKFASRLSCPLSGVCILPKDKNFFTVLQSTSLGDIFYQDYRQCDEAVEKTYRVGTGCVLTPPEKILPHLNGFISGDSDTDEVYEDADEKIARSTINIEKILTIPAEISTNCTACRSADSNGDKKLVISDICPRCKLNSKESECLSKAETNLSAIIGPTSETPSFLESDIDFLSQFPDPYSKRLLSVWSEPENIAESQTTYDQSIVFTDED